MSSTKNREQAVIKRRRPAPKDRCIVPVHYYRPGATASLSLKLYAMAKLLHALAFDCERTDDTL
jgi:hypothetical protein